MKNLLTREEISFLLSQSPWKRREDDDDDFLDDEVEIDIPSLHAVDTDFHPISSRMPIPSKIILQ